MIVPQRGEERSFEPQRAQRAQREERYSRRGGFTISLIFIIYLGEAGPTDTMVIEIKYRNYTLK
jgi:hypothetical protein